MRTSCVVAVLLLCSGSAFADEPAMPDFQNMQKFMQMWEQLAAPAPEHAALARMAGDWKVISKVWFGPGVEPQVTEGTSHAEMIFGGRFLEFVDHGSMMGAAFTGKGHIGFDKYRARYWMSWFDDMGTALLTATGTMDEAGKLLTFRGKMDEPLQDKKDKDVKYVIRWVNDDTRVFEIYDAVDTPEEFRTVEMTYSRTNQFRRESSDPGELMR